MKIIFLPPSDKELEEAVVYYNAQMQGLGDQFYDEVQAAIEIIIKFPNCWQKIEKHTRKYILKHFPYLMLYITRVQISSSSTTENTF